MLCMSLNYIYWTFSIMQPSSLTDKEAIPLYALLMALTALSMDLLLPAFPYLEAHFALSDLGNLALIIPILIFGMVFGELFFGPFSDRFGRKPSLYIGLTLYILATIYAVFAPTLDHLLVARFFQGIAVSGPKIATRAMVRDQYDGADMARFMSIIMAILILFPMIAPALGQALILLFGWQSLFVFLILNAFCAMIWMHLRQPETLQPHQRLPFSGKLFLRNTLRIVMHLNVLAYTLAVGLIFGCILGYLSISQSIFQTLYKTGSYFPLYFAVLAMAVGLAAVVNSQIVKKLGMHVIVLSALICLFAISLITLILCYYWQGLLPLPLFMICFLSIFFCFGLLFSNLNTLAMTYLGHIAGLGASINSSLSSLVGFIVASSISHLYDLTLIPLVMTFLGISCCTICLVLFAKNHEMSPVMPYRHGKN